MFDYKLTQIDELSNIIAGDKLGRSANKEKASNRLAALLEQNGVAIADIVELPFDDAAAMLTDKAAELDAAETEVEPEPEVVTVKPKAKPEPRLGHDGLPVRVSLKGYDDHPALVSKDDVLNGEASGAGSLKKEGKAGWWIYRNKHGHEITVTNRIDWADAPDGCGWYATTEYQGKKFEAYAGSVFSAANRISYAAIKGTEAE